MRSIGRDRADRRGEIDDRGSVDSISAQRSSGLLSSDDWGGVHFLLEFRRREILDDSGGGGLLIRRVYCSPFPFVSTRRTPAVGSRGSVHRNGGVVIERSTTLSGGKGDDKTVGC